MARGLDSAWRAAPAQWQKTAGARGDKTMKIAIAGSFAVRLANPVRRGKPSLGAIDPVS
jgi:hypothetical protein